MWTSFLAIAVVLDCAQSSSYWTSVYSVHTHSGRVDSYSNATCLTVSLRKKLSLFPVEKTCFLKHVLKQQGMQLKRHPDVGSWRWLVKTVLSQDMHNLTRKQIWIPVESETLVAVFHYRVLLSWSETCSTCAELHQKLRKMLCWSWVSLVSKYMLWLQMSLWESYGLRVMGLDLFICFLFPHRSLCSSCDWSSVFSPFPVQTSGQHVQWPSPSVPRRSQCPSHWGKERTTR